MDSDGTLILFDGTLTAGELTGGTQLTSEVAHQHTKPFLLIDASKMAPTQATEAIKAWVRAHDLKILNVAGPRASGWPGGSEYALQVIRKLLQA